MRYTVVSYVTKPRALGGTLRVAQVNADTAETALRWAAAEARGEGLRTREATVLEGWAKVTRFAPEGGGGKWNR